MSATVITIVAGKQAPLDDKTLEKASALVKSLGVDSVSCDVLNRGIAADVKTNAGGAGLEKALREKFASFGAYDVFVQEDNTHRRKKLLVADMDATMVEGETLDEIAARLNLKDKIAPITAKAMRGEIDFEEALRMRVGLLKDKPVSALFETLEAMRYSAGAKTLVGTMARHGARCVLISGGFDLFTGRVAQTLGFHANIGNRLGIEGDRLTGDVIPSSTKMPRRRRWRKNPASSASTPNRPPPPWAMARMIFPCCKPQAQASATSASPPLWRRRRSRYAIPTLALSCICRAIARKKSRYKKPAVKAGPLS